MTPFDTHEIESFVNRTQLRIGSSVVYVSQTQSTNDDASRAAHQNAEHGTLFLADEQTQGRGRLGRSWWSEPGQSLLLSLVLRPQIKLCKLPLVSLLAGLAVCETAAQYIHDPTLGIKWPNDVWVRGRKLAGILTETSLAGHEVSHVVLGIGINLTQARFPDELATTATSLLLEGIPLIDRTSVLLTLLQRLDARLLEAEQDGFDSMIHRISELDLLKGAQVVVNDELGVAVGISTEGALRLRGGDGLVRDVISGEAQLTRPVSSQV